MFSTISKEVLAVIVVISVLAIKFKAIAGAIIAVVKMLKYVFKGIKLITGSIGTLKAVIISLSAAIKATIINIAKGIAVIVGTIVGGIAGGLKIIAGTVIAVTKMLGMVSGKGLVVLGLLTGAIALIIHKITNLVNAITPLIAEFGKLGDSGQELREAALGVAALGLAIIALLPVVPAVLAASGAFVGFGISMTGASVAAGLLAAGLSRVVREMESIQRLRPAIAQGITVNRRITMEGEPPTSGVRKENNTFALENGDDILRALLDIRDAVRGRREAERRI
jgi:hypothetical protein